MMALRTSWGSPGLLLGDLGAFCGGPFSKERKRSFGMFLAGGPKQGKEGSIIKVIMIRLLTMITKKKKNEKEKEEEKKNM